MAARPDFILGVDLDGVVGDHTYRFREILAELRGVDPETLPLERSWDFGEWGLSPEEYARYHRIAVMEHDMFATMPVPRRGSTPTASRTATCASSAPSRKSKPTPTSTTRPTTSRPCAAPATR